MPALQYTLQSCYDIILGDFRFCDMLVLSFDCNWKNKAFPTGPGCSGVQIINNMLDYGQSLTAFSGWSPMKWNIWSNSDVV